MADCGLHFGLHVVVVTHLFRYARGIILFLLIIRLANAQPQSFDYPAIDQDHHDGLQLEGDAYYSHSGSIQLTGNTLNPDKGFSVGGVTSSTPITLWRKDSQERYDFSTTFSFVIYSHSKNKNQYGDGLAFFLASLELPIGSVKAGGGGLGLMDANQPLPSVYSFVAVEFDTFQNDWEPTQGTHVGVDFNSMRSSAVTEWWADISERKVYNCTIEYKSRNLKVSFTGYPSSGIATQHLLYDIDITQALPETVIVGVSAATGNNSEQHSLLSWKFSTSLQEADHKKVNTTLIEGLGIGIGLAVSLLVLVLVRICMWKRGKRKDELTPDSNSDLKMDREFEIGTGPKRISYEKLVSATDNFEEAKKLGRSGFGGVYKGYFKDRDSYAAIKKISADSRQGMKEYAAKVMVISQLRHRNLVKLTGWCHKKNDLILIYEYIPNGSLYSCLFDEEGLLSWMVRYTIAQGLASALLYLQEECDKCVLHRDIKSSNIMLDSNFNAKLGDFGLARLVDHEKGSQTTVNAGTMGYIAPEYMKTGKARKESDIYSFGVVLLEIASGRKAVHHQYMEGRVTQVSLVEWVWELYGLRNLLEAAYPNLCEEFDVQQMECLLVVGLWCAHPDCKSRPSIRQGIKFLNFEGPLPILPRKMPLLPYLPSAITELFFTVLSSFTAQIEPEINRM